MTESRLLEADQEIPKHVHVISNIQVRNCASSHEPIKILRGIKSRKTDRFIGSDELY